MPRAINGVEGVTSATTTTTTNTSSSIKLSNSPLPSSSSSTCSSSSSASSTSSTVKPALNQTSTPNKRNQHDTTLNIKVNGNNAINGQQSLNKQLATSNNNNNNNNNTSSDDLASTDEIKVYKDEGAAEEEQRSSENLNEDKIGLVNETEEEKPSILSHPFSVNNLMLYNGQDHMNSNAAAAAAAQFGFSRNLYHPSLYPPEFAHFASWWPAAAGLYNPLSNPHLRDTFPFSTAFSSANYNQVQQAAAAAFSRFNPSLFLPQSSTNQNSNTLSFNNAGHSSNNNNINNSNSSNNNNNNITNSNSSQHHSMSNSNSNMASSINHNRNSNTSLLSNNASHSYLSSSRTNNELNHNNHSSAHLQHHNSNRHKNHSSNNGMGNSSAIQSGEIEIETKSKKPHIKKPLNAFMLFMKEQRAKVVSECTLRESAAINQILGRKWHELDRADQAKYYEMARQERLKHMQLYPGWSARDNYGLKKKRRRKREKIIGENGELPRKCRARYGLHQINLWCKPCRRKKKCIRFTNQDEMMNNGMSVGMQNSNVPNNMGLGFTNMNMGGMINNVNGVFGSGSIGEGSSGGVSGSLNGGNSDDDFDEYDDDDGDDDHDDDDDDENDYNDSQDSDTENKDHNHNHNHTNNIVNNINNNNSNNIMNTNNRAINHTINSSVNSNNINMINSNMNIHSLNDNLIPLDHQQRNEILLKTDNL